MSRNTCHQRWIDRTAAESPCATAHKTSSAASKPACAYRIDPSRSGAARWALGALGRYPYRRGRLRAAVDQRARRQSLRRSSSRRLHSFWRPDPAPSSLAIPNQPGHSVRVDGRCWRRAQRIHDFSVLYALARSLPRCRDLPLGTRCALTFSSTEYGLGMRHHGIPSRCSTIWTRASSFIRVSRSAFRSNSSRRP